MSPDFTMPVFSADPPSIKAFTVTRTNPDGSSSSTNKMPTPVIDVCKTHEDAFNPNVLKNMFEPWYM
jgi:hypothetical protein